MKKALIAGAASVALAAMPVVGVFAEGATSGSSTYTDQLNVTVSTICTFARATDAHPAGTWTTDTTDTTLDKLSAVTISTLNAETSIGSSSFKVVCNNFAGSQVTVSGSALAVTNGDSMTYNATATGTAGTWRLASTGTGADVTENKVYYEAGATDNETFTVTYYAYPDSEQGAGAYQGTAAYTFAQL